MNRIEKVAARVVALIATAVLAGGCSTPIGLFSYMAYDSNQAAWLERSLKASEKIQTPEKPKILRAYANGCSESTLAVGLGVDILELFSSKYTTGEKLTMAGTQLLDLTTYTAILDRLLEELGKRLNKDKDKSPTPSSAPSVTINGNNNTVTYGTLER